MIIIVKDDVDLDARDEDDTHSFSFELIITEVICKKDSAKIPKLAINDKLAEAIEEIAEGKSEVKANAKGEVSYSFLTA